MIFITNVSYLQHLWVWWLLQERKAQYQNTPKKGYEPVMCRVEIFCYLETNNPTYHRSWGSSPVKLTSSAVNVSYDVDDPLSSKLQTCRCSSRRNEFRVVYVVIKKVLPANSYPRGSLDKYSFGLWRMPLLRQALLSLSRTMLLPPIERSLSPRTVLILSGWCSTRRKATTLFLPSS